jgi:hypothetical protein
MEVRIKDITGALYESAIVDKVLENREQIILRYTDNSEAIFIKKNIIYAVRGCETDDIHSSPKQ